MATLFGVNASPFVRKVRVVLAEKKIPYDLDPVVLHDRGPLVAWVDGHERHERDSAAARRELL